MTPSETYLFFQSCRLDLWEFPWVWSECLSHHQFFHVICKAGQHKSISLWFLLSFVKLMSSCVSWGVLGAVLMLDFFLGSWFSSVSLFFCIFLSFCFLVFFVFSFHFATFSSQFSVCSSVFHLFSLFFVCMFLSFCYVFSQFSRFCGLFLSNRYTFCYIPCSCFEDFTCFFNFTFVSFHFVIMSCSFEFFSFQLAICWTHFAIFRAGYIHI